MEYEKAVYEFEKWEIKCKSFGVTDDTEIIDEINALKILIKTIEL